ncbi:MAG TPA: YetF domain-containing protein [Anaerolineales bacterium]|nr:YetF domain-containing protein [Anaerolineales bacterium]
MIFDGWSGLYRTLIVGVLAYIALVLLLRVSGKRTLSKWNAFDFIVTVALGSSLATALLSRQVPLAQGVLGFALLILLQFLVTWLSVRSKGIHRLIKAEPALLLHKGQFLPEIMQRERVTESEIRAALREKGIADVAQVEAVVLETDGSFSVIKQAGQVSRSTLIDVSGFEQQG